MTLYRLSPLWLAAASLVVTCSHATATADELLRFQVNDQSMTLRVEVEHSGRSLGACGNEAIDALFAHCDVDNDQLLDRDELRWLPTPFSLRQLYWRRVLPATNSPTETNSTGNEAWTVDRLRAYYADDGWGQPAICYGKSETSMRLHAALLEQLVLHEETDFSFNALSSRLDRLKMLDRNADRKLSPEELLAGATYPATSAAQLLTPIQQIAEGKVVQLLSADTANGTSDERLNIRFSMHDSPVVDWASNPELVYHHAHLRIRLHPLNQPLEGLDRLEQLIAENPAEVAGSGRQVTAGLLRDIVDRNRDQTLQPKELSSWREVHRRLTEALCCLTLIDLERSLYGWIDKNFDGCLSFVELDDLTHEDTSARLFRDGRLDVPYQIELLISRERPTEILRRSLEVPHDDQRPLVPAWFASMDRNRDGVLHKQEFLGDQSTFDRFDADGDAVLNPVEAAKTNAKP